MEAIQMITEIPVKATEFDNRDKSELLIIELFKLPTK